MPDRGAESEWGFLGRARSGLKREQVGEVRSAHQAVAAEAGLDRGRLPRRGAVAFEAARADILSGWTGIAMSSRFATGATGRRSRSP